MAQPIENAQRAKPGDTVRVDYTGRLEDGTVFDSSEGREPLEFAVGAGQVIPGFDEAVTGMAVGEKKTVTIPSDEAYGPYDENLIMEVGKDEFPPDMNLQPGDMLQLRQPDGSVFAVVVTNISDNTVTLDGNHPLAGHDLTFDITLVEIV
jgi:FKBP-type peptidyl-prolyl cis-trans isomerase 2